MTDEPWTGEERRAVSPQALAHQVGEIIKECLEGKNSRHGTQPNQVPWIVWAAFLSALVIVGVFMVIRIATKTDTVLDENRDFRKSLTCFVIEDSRLSDPPPPGAYASILNQCGFVEQPGERP